MSKKVLDVQLTRISESMNIQPNLGEQRGSIQSQAQRHLLQNDMTAQQSSSIASYLLIEQSFQLNSSTTSQQFDLSFDTDYQISLTSFEDLINTSLNRTSDPIDHFLNFLRSSEQPSLIQNYLSPSAEKRRTIQEDLQQSQTFHKSSQVFPQNVNDQFVNSSTNILQTLDRQVSAEEQQIVNSDASIIVNSQNLLDTCLPNQQQSYNISNNNHCSQYNSDSSQKRHINSLQISTNPETQQNHQNECTVPLQSAQQFSQNDENPQSQSDLNQSSFINQFDNDQNSNQSSFQENQDEQSSNQQLKTNISSSKTHINKTYDQVYDDQKTKIQSQQFKKSKNIKQYLAVLLINNYRIYQYIIKGKKKDRQEGLERFKHVVRVKEITVIRKNEQFEDYKQNKKFNTALHLLQYQIESQMLYQSFGKIQKYPLQIIYAVLCALKTFQQIGLLYLDLRLANIMYKKSCFKLIDYDCAFFVRKHDENDENQQAYDCTLKLFKIWLNDGKDHLKKLKILLKQETTKCNIGQLMKIRKEYQDKKYKLSYNEVHDLLNEKALQVAEYLNRITQQIHKNQLQSLIIQIKNYLLQINKYDSSVQNIFEQLLNELKKDSINYDEMKKLLEPCEF